ncbi:MAG TPA: multicopper oxidase domain-containing protein, partial [Terriglobales bacterium]
VVELLPASMVSADMIADNSGTWLFHCQVSDHIESGMLATYTIYEPQTRACPIKFEGGSFWEGAGKEFSVTVRNTGDKPINRLILAPGMFLSRLDLRSSMTSWTWAKPIAPGQQQTITSKNVLYNTQDLAGWAFYPRMVEYADGSKWQPEQAGECFQVYWRDHNYPELPVLPAFQIEVGED